MIGDRAGLTWTIRKRCAIISTSSLFQPLKGGTEHRGLHCVRLLTAFQEPRCRWSLDRTISSIVARYALSLTNEGLLECVLELKAELRRAQGLKPCMRWIASLRLGEGLKGLMLDHQHVCMACLNCGHGFNVYNA